MPSHRIVRRGIALCLLLAGLHGCASLAGRAAGRATPSVIEGSLRTLDDPENRQIIEHLLTSPEVNEGARQLASSLANGAFSQLTAEEQAQRLEALSQQFASAFLTGLIASASEDRNRLAMIRLTHDLSLSAGRGLAQGISTQLTPEDREAFLADLHDILADASRQMSKGVAEGMYEGLERQREVQGIAPEETIDARIRQLLMRGNRIVTYGVILLLLTPLILLVWFLLSLAHRRRDRRRREEERRARRERIAAAGPGTAASAESISPLVAQALREALRDPALRQSLLNELQRGDQPPSSTH